MNGPLNVKVVVSWDRWRDLQAVGIAYKEMVEIVFFKSWVVQCHSGPNC
jgi:hypothetical membrane protein